MSIKLSEIVNYSLHIAQYPAIMKKFSEASFIFCDKLFPFSFVCTKVLNFTLSSRKTFFLVERDLLLKKAAAFSRESAILFNQHPRGIIIKMDLRRGR